MGVKSAPDPADVGVREADTVTNDHQHPEHEHYVRRVVLPSGKTIEVVYFEDHVFDGMAQRQPLPIPVSDDVDLHICGTCESDLVYPVEWDEAGSTHWEVTLRCPNCELASTGVYAQETVERFDEELDRGTEALVRDLKRLMTANMEDEIERFVRALDSNAILPEDF
jgi:hypothetical protein